MDDFHPSYMFLSPPHCILFMEHNLVYFARSIFGLVFMENKEAIQNGMICSLLEFGSWDDLHSSIHPRKSVSKASDFFVCLAKGCLELGFVASSKAIQSGMISIHTMCFEIHPIHQPVVIRSVFCMRFIRRWFHDK